MKAKLKAAPEKAISFLKYLCNRCHETFDVFGSYHPEDFNCPYCGSREITESNLCLLQSGPPPWEFSCLRCGIRFRIKSPKGPDEAKAVRCLKCGSIEVKWMVGATQDCAPGG